jgi:HK97 family phage major capsid protein/HK97 family phage prohead protease
MPNETRKTINLNGPQIRNATAAAINVTRSDDLDEKVRISFSLSSEAPVERFYGTEILSHEKGAIRLDRAASGAMPLLFNHDWNDPIGMVDRAYLDGGRLHVDARMFDTDRAREVQTMVDGGLRNVSVGYDVHEFIEDRKSGTFTAVDWSPMEASIVTIPADFSVGIGRTDPVMHTRSVPVRAHEFPAAPAALSMEDVMSQETTPTAGAAAAENRTPDIRVTADFDAVKSDQARSATIRKFAEANAIHDENTIAHWVRSGKTWDAIADEILTIRRDRAKLTDSPSYLGLTTNETKRFSVVRAVRAIADGSWKNAEFEAECSRTIAERLGKPLNATSFMVPVDVQQRTLQVGTAAQGGYIVGTDLQPGSFIDMLRNTSVGFRLGARTLSGLQGVVVIPRQATGGSVAWIGELGTATASELTVGALTLSPKHVAGYQQISRQLLMQSTPDAEMLVQSDLAAAVALGVDSAMLAGTSADSSVPLGIRYQSGLGTANPGTGSAVSYQDMIKFQSTVASANALFTGFGYVCHPAIAAVLMGKPRFTNSDTPIWEGALLEGQVVGKRALASVQITSGTMLGGDFSQVLVGEWGSLEIAINPFAVFQSGIIGVRAIYSCDIGVRYGAAFAIGTGITG